MKWQQPWAGSASAPGRGRAWERRELLLRTAPFAAITLLAFVTVPLGGLPTDGLLLGIAIGLTLLVALSVAVLPWARLPTVAILAPPFIGLAVVALLRAAQGGAASGYGGLVLISVLWLALYGTRTQLLVLCAGVLAVFIVPIIAVGAPDYPEAEWRRAILTLALSLFIGLVTQGLVRQVRARAAEARQRAREDRRREAYLRAVMDSAAEGIVAVDADGRVAFANPAAARMFGYSAEELAGEPIHDLVHHTRADGTPYPPEECPTLRALQTGRETVVSDEVYWRRDGSSFPVEYRSTPMIADGEMIGVVNTFVDISERLAVQRVKDEFVSLVSHELRTPLTSIRGSLGLLQGGVVGELPDEAQEMLAIAISNADRLVRLINDILDVERIESGKAPMEARECNLASLMESTRDLLTPAAEADGVTLDVKPVDAPLEADPDRIIQTLVNLVGNAIKFSPDDGVVSVRGEIRNARARVVVSDQGPGISPEMRDKIFDRFAQISTGDTRNERGSGLGLAIARGIVEQHGGRIWVEPAEGGGSAFAFELPVAHRAPEPEIEEATPAGARLGALIVEDDHDLAQVLATSLTRHGVTTRLAGDAEEAIALLDDESPELIVLDLMLPGSPGTDVIAHLRDEDRAEESAIVIYTGLDLDREELAELRGFADVVTKSKVSSEEFEEMLLAVLDRLRSPSPQPAD